MAKAGSIIGDRQYHLSVPYLRSKRTGVGASRRFQRPSATELRAGQALGHPRPDGPRDEIAMGIPSQPGTQTDPPIAPTKK
jgi:hypothetical protein